MTFAEIEQILGFPLPDSSRNYAAGCSSYEGSTLARVVIDAGWHAEALRLIEQRS